MKKRTKYIILFIGVFIVLVATAPFAYNFYMDKRAQKLAEQRIEETRPLLEKYVKDNYPDLKYTIKDVYHDIKGNQVYMDLDVHDSEDKDFTVYIDDGNHIFSTYNEVTEDKANAWSRIYERLTFFESKKLENQVFDDNFDYTFLTLDEEAYSLDLPEFDEPIETLILKYPISADVFVKDASIYTIDEIEESKSQIMNLYLKEGLKIDSVVINDLKTHKEY